MIDCIQVVVDNLAWDLYGNYVLQKILTIKLDNAVKTCILEELTQRQTALAATVHGQKMLQKLRSTHPSLFAKANAANLIQRAKPGAAPKGKRMPKHYPGKGKERNQE